MEEKIREWCRQIFSLEWSGTLFYSIEGTFEDNNLAVICRDFYVSDIGSGAYTEFDTVPDILTYQDEHDLLECYQGLIHSHNHMQAFFSTTDVATLREEAEKMPHFVSLIVNNTGEYTARITRRLISVTSHASYMTFGGEMRNTEFTSPENIIQYFDLEIVKPDSPLHNEVSERIKAIREEQKKRQQTAPAAVNPVLFPTAPSPIKTFPVVKDVKTPDKPPVLVKQNENFQETVIRLARQIITGSVTSGWGNKFDMTNWLNKVMAQVFTRRFPDADNLYDWLDTYISYIISSEAASSKYTGSIHAVEDRIAEGILNYLESFKADNYVLKMIKDYLNNYLIKD